MPAANELLKVTYYFQAGAQGWSESYYLAQTNYVSAQPVAQSLGKALLQVRGGNISINYAKMSFVDSERESYPVYLNPMSGLGLDTEQGPPVVVEPSHDVFSAVHIRFYTAAGKSVSRLFRGARDSHVHNSLTAFTITPAAPYVEPDGTATKDEAWSMMVAMVLDLTSYVVKDPNNPGQYLATAWDFQDVRGVSRRDTGRPFGVPRGRQPAFS